MNIPVRDGHKVLIIWGAAEGCADGKYKYWENLTTGEKSFTNYAKGEFADLILRPNELKEHKKKANQMLIGIGICVLLFTFIFPLFIAAFLGYRLRTKNKEFIKSATTRVEIVKPLILGYRDTLVTELEQI